jgi:hypothetical protein
MRPATSSTASWLAAAALAAVVATSGGLVAAQSAPDGENGRYSMTPIPEGVLRLDTRTGTMSTCTRNGAGWACYAVPDERTAMDAEIGRLQAENEKLRARLASRDGTVQGKVDEALPKGTLPKSDKAAPKVAENERKIEIPLPSDQDMDRVMSFVERAWRRLVDIANRIQKDAAGKI